MSTCDGTRNIRAVPRRNQRHERPTKTVVTSPLRKSWPRKSNPIYTLEGLMLRVPTHIRMAVTGARVPRVRVSARLRTRQPGAPGERLRHRHTHGGPPGGAPTGHAGERSGSIGLHDGGPVVRGTSSSGHRG